MRAPGTEAADEFAAYLKANKMDVIGTEIAVQGPLSKRQYDIVIRDSAGRYHGIEVKTGGASKNTYQDFTDRFVDIFGAPGKGRLKGITIQSTSTVYLP